MILEALPVLSVKHSLLLSYISRLVVGVPGPLHELTVVQDESVHQQVQLDSDWFEVVGEGRNVGLGWRDILWWSSPRLCSS